MTDIYVVSDASIVDGFHAGGLTIAVKAEVCQ